MQIEVHKQIGGVLHAISLTGPNGAKSFMLIADCATDGQVLTQIRERYGNLVGQGYTQILGLRDVYPLTHADIARLRVGLANGIPTGNVPVEIHLAVLETEAWFLDEWTHFERIDPSLTEANRKAGGFDLRSNPGEQWPHPARTLSSIYRLAKKTYLTAGGRRKRAYHIDRTISTLDPEELYVSVAARSASFGRFVSSLETALF